MWYVTAWCPFWYRGVDNFPSQTNTTISSSGQRHNLSDVLLCIISVSPSPPLAMKTKDAAVPPMRVEKWSTKPADYNTARVRNNQRRHRARVKSHIQDLEMRLEDTSAKLESALSTIASLTAELEALRRGTPVTAGQPRALARSTAPTTPIPTSCDGNDGCNTTDVVITYCATLPQEVISGNTADCDCQGLQSPAPGESTVPCSSAFQMIEQQNYTGVEVTTIRAWLGPGFRKALKPGESCRVESSRLYELLDHITSTT